MTFGELSRRIGYVVLAWLVGAGLTWIWREELLVLLAEPLVRAWTNGELPRQEVYYISPPSLFPAYVRVAALGGVILASPVVFYQIWAFVAHGHPAQHKRFAVPYVLTSCSLLALGGWIGSRFLLPAAFISLVSRAGDVGLFSVKQTITLADYVQFVTQGLLAFGLCGELLVLIFFASVAGLLTHRQLIRYSRHFAVLAFVVAAVVTPPDVLSQLLLAVPLCAFYGASIVIAYAFAPSRADVPRERPT